MKVVILCGGLGTRLREETEFIPKPMIEIGGKPMIWHIMKIYAYYGFREFILCLGYKGEMIKEYFLNYEGMNNDFTIKLGKPSSVEFHSNHTEDGWRVTLADTGENTMTGSRIKKIERYIDGDEFMATYGDGLANVDIGNLLELHRRQKKTATLTGVHPLSRFGEVVEDHGIVKEFIEKPQLSEGYINGGFFVFNRKVFDYLSDGDNCVLEKEPMEKLTKQKELAVYPHDGFWQCMDTYRDYKFLQEMWQKGDVPWKVWKK